ncbi:extensin family protein [Prosthecomicrobium pneumaticum]|uniref:Extensin-like C-terminal domain-containing protein n=1 Tax=Prosthecomicrobium pneumaticum TaxID=81895 RepID=A0A7W9FQF9_9HYPH|nr:extensin family protein [Prosthecomicrobium pneumaticum]MBB5754977.1 hypothetical protein [Prosthecomicrobium pneumaticum]
MMPTAGARFARRRRALALAAALCLALPPASLVRAAPEPSVGTVLRAMIPPASAFERTAPPRRTAKRPLAVAPSATPPLPRPRPDEAAEAEAPVPEDLAEIEAEKAAHGPASAAKEPAAPDEEPALETRVGSVAAGPAVPKPRPRPEIVQAAVLAARELDAPVPAPAPLPAPKEAPALRTVRAGVLGVPPAVLEAPQRLATEVPAEPLGFASPAPRVRDPLLGLIPPPRPEPPAKVVPAAFPPAVAPAPPPDLAACRVEMGRMAIKAVAEPPVHEGTCGNAAPFEVSALEDGAVALTPGATLNCAMTTRLAEFLAEEIQPAALAAFGERVSALRIADSYSCRGRNRVVGAMLSEHAFMNAVDIGAFKVGDRWVEVAKGGDQTATEAEFVQTVRRAGCKHFTTVLGHGSDGYHENHLHFDLRQRGKRTRVYCH